MKEQLRRKRKVASLALGKFVAEQACHFCIEILLVLNNIPIILLLFVHKHCNEEC
jgi:hypothetical protein